MKLSRADIVPVLAIVGGGALGAMSVGLLLSLSSIEGRSDLVVMERGPQETRVVHFRPGQGQTIEFRIEERDRQRVLDVQRTRVRPSVSAVLTRSREVMELVQPQVYVDGAKVDISFLDDLATDDLEFMTVERGPVVVERHGVDAAGGAILIRLSSEAASVR